MINVSEGISYNENTGKFITNIDGTDYTIGNMSLNFPSTLTSSNLYTKGDTGYTSPAKIHQDRPFSCWKPNPFNIKDINVIVPGKVMVVTFEDNRQENWYAKKEIILA